MPKKIVMRKEFPNPENITKRMKLKNKIKTITVKDGETIMEIEFEKEATDEDTELVKQYFKNNPYWEIVKREGGDKDE